MRTRTAMLAGLTLLAFWAAWLAPPSASGESVAQGGDYDLPWWTADGGGGRSVGGSYILLGAVGQPEVGTTLSGGGFALAGGYWAGGRYWAGAPGETAVYLPLTVRNYTNYAASCDASNRYCEDYDSWENAYGPLEPGAAYSAYPEDSTDYYYFDVGTATTATVALSDYQASGDLILYRHRTGDEPQYLANWGLGGSTMTLTHALQPGKYYIRVYTTAGHNSTTLYTLAVTTN